MSDEPRPDQPAAGDDRTREQAIPDMPPADKGPEWPPAAPDTGATSVSQVPSEESADWPPPGATRVSETVPEEPEPATEALGDAAADFPPPPEAGGDNTPGATVQADVPAPIDLDQDTSETEAVSEADVAEGDAAPPADRFEAADAPVPPVQPEASAAEAGATEAPAAPSADAVAAAAAAEPAPTYSAPEPPRAPEPPPAAVESSSAAGGGLFDDRPELMVGAAFAGGLVIAMILKRLANR